MRVLWWLLAVGCAGGSVFPVRVEGAYSGTAQMVNTGGATLYWKLYSPVETFRNASSVNAGATNQYWRDGASTDPFDFKVEWYTWPGVVFIKAETKSCANAGTVWFFCDGSAATYYSNYCATICWTNTQYVAGQDVVWEVYRGGQWERVAAKSLPQSSLPQCVTYCSTNAFEFMRAVGDRPEQDVDDYVYQEPHLEGHETPPNPSDVTEEWEDPDWWLNLTDEELGALGNGDRAMLQALKELSDFLKRWGNGGWPGTNGGASGSNGPVNLGTNFFDFTNWLHLIAKQQQTNIDTLNSNAAQAHGDFISKTNSDFGILSNIWGIYSNRFVRITNLMASGSNAAAAVFGAGTATSNLWYSASGLTNVGQGLLDARGVEVEDAFGRIDVLVVSPNNPQGKQYRWDAKNFLSASNLTALGTTFPSWFRAVVIWGSLAYFLILAFWTMTERVIKLLSLPPALANKMIDDWAEAGAVGASSIAAGPLGFLISYLGAEGLDRFLKTLVVVGTFVVIAFLPAITLALISLTLGQQGMGLGGLASLGATVVNVPSVVCKVMSVSEVWIPWIEVTVFWINYGAYCLVRDFASIGLCATLRWMGTVAT